MENVKPDVFVEEEAVELAKLVFKSDPLSINNFKSVLMSIFFKM